MSEQSNFVCAVHSPAGTATVRIEGEMKIISIEALQSGFSGPFQIVEFSDTKLSITGSSHIRFGLGIDIGNLANGGGAIVIEATQGASIGGRYGDGDLNNGNMTQHADPGSSKSFPIFT